MRQGDGNDLHPKAVERRRQQNIRFYSGLALALVGVIIMFTDDQFYLGAVLAMTGTGLVPFDKLVGLVKK